MNVFKINFEIFKKRFKITTPFKLIEVFVLTLFIISLIHIGFIFTKQYEKIYILKALLFYIISIEFIFPNYNLNAKLRLKLFFGKLKNKEIENYYISKNLIISSIVGFFVFIPYKLNLIQLSLLYITIMGLLFLSTISLRKIFFKINFQVFLLIIRFSIISFFISFVNKETGEKFKIFANKVPLILYILLFFIFIYISILLLNSIKSKYFKNHNFSKILINSEKYLGYNILYMLRSGIFIRNIFLFYTMSFLTFYKENIKNATMIFAIYIVLNGVSTLFETLKIEYNRVNFIYDKLSIKKIYFLKIIDNIKLLFISIIFMFPIIYFKIGHILTLKIIFNSIFITISTILILIKFVQKNKHILNKNHIIIAIIINIVLTIIIINLLT